jgi:hypothetical protein
MQRDRRVIQIEPRYSCRYHHLRTAFLRLDKGAAGERLAGNAGGKTRIVLNPGWAPACPPKARTSNTTTDKPSDAA